MLYLSFYPQGLKEIISDVIKFYIKTAEVFYLTDTSITYKTDLKYEEVGKIECFESSFLLIKLVKGIDKKSLKNLYNWAMSNQIFYQKVKEFSKNKYSFRVVDSGIYNVKKMFANERERLESRLFSYGVKVDRGNPDFEIRFAEKDQFSFIGIRISKPPQYKDKNQKGSLIKEIVSVMLYLSEPSKDDTFLDPFCGTGAIPLKRAQLATYKEIIATDKSIGSLKTKANRLKNFTLKEINYNHLSKYLKHKVNKIVTDPPWGMIEDTIDIKKFYREMFDQFKKVLLPNGVIVLLTNRKRILNSIIQENKEYHLIKKIEVKVSGLTSYIFKIKFSPINI